MGPKTKKAARENLKAEDVLQAVVFADSFMKPRFTPLTAEVPKVRTAIVEVAFAPHSIPWACVVPCLLRGRVNFVVALTGPSAAGECADD